MNRNDSIVVGIDQSSGSSSAVGVAVMTADLDLIDSAEFMPKKRYLIAEKRIVDLHEQVEAYLAKYVRFAIENQMRMHVVFEKTVMQGMAGETLAESVGAFAATFPSSDLVYFAKVHNTTMKKMIAGHGAGDKVAVAKGLIKLMPETAHERILSLINAKKYDTLDAIALAACHVISGGLLVNKQ